MTQTIEDEIREEQHRARVIKRAGGARTLHVHNLVAEQAREMALVMYENVMSSNQVRTEWKRRHPGASELGLQAAFVRKYWRSHLPASRAILAGMLAQPQYSAMHEKIHEALLLDNMLVRGRAGANYGSR